MAIDMAGVRLLTDPLLRERVGHLRRRSVEVASEAFANTAAALVSHAHHDHLDLPSLRLLERGTRLVVAPGVGSIVGKLGFEVVELSPGERTEVEGVTITATEAEHSGGRNPLRRDTATVGFLVEAGATRIYFAGDTDLFDVMASLAPLDAALLPIWGWGPKLGAGHLNPDSAAEALKMLRPRVAVPIHWGTLSPIGGRLREHHLHEPPRAFARAAASIAPAVDVRIVEPGDSTEL